MKYIEEYRKYISESVVKNPYSFQVDSENLKAMYDTYDKYGVIVPYEIKRGTEKYLFVKFVYSFDLNKCEMIIDDDFTGYGHQELLEIISKKTNTKIPFFDPSVSWGFFYNKDYYFKEQQNTILVHGAFSKKMIDNLNKKISKIAKDYKSFKMDLNNIKILSASRMLEDHIDPVAFKYSEIDPKIKYKGENAYAERISYLFPNRWSRKTNAITDFKIKDIKKMFPELSLSSAMEVLTILDKRNKRERERRGDIPTIPKALKSKMAKDVWLTTKYKFTESKIIKEYNNLNSRTRIPKEEYILKILDFLNYYYDKFKNSKTEYISSKDLKFKKIAKIHSLSEEMLNIIKDDEFKRIDKTKNYMLVYPNDRPTEEDAEIYYEDFKRRNNKRYAKNKDKQSKKYKKKYNKNIDKSRKDARENARKNRKNITDIRPAQDPYYMDPSNWGDSDKNIIF